MNAAEQLLGEAALARRAEHVALLCGEEAVTYADLARRVRAAASLLRSRGVRTGERVLLLLRDTPQCAAWWLASLYAGAVAVSVNPRLSEIDVQHIAADSAARLAIVEDALRATQPGLVAKLACEGRLIDAGESAAESGEPAAEATDASDAVTGQSD